MALMLNFLNVMFFIILIDYHIDYYDIIISKFCLNIINIHYQIILIVFTNM